jgi:hypothetical protein
MDDMSKHSEHYAAGVPIRRARASAWMVFWLTAGTSVLYNSYHALVNDHMPWYTGLPEGFVPLVVAIGVLEFSVSWRDNKFLQGAAWLVTAAAMAWSAVQINSVVSHGWALGLIADTAALSAMYFLLNGPTALQAVAKVAAREADLLRQRDSERSAREQAEAAGRTALADLKARAEAELAKRDAAWREEMAILRAGLSRELDDMRTACETAETAFASARSEAETVTRKLEAAERKLGRANGVTGSRKRAGSGSRKPEAVPAPAVPGGIPEAPADLDAESAVLWYVDQGLSASAAGVAAGLSDSRGRQIVRKLTAPAPAGVDPVATAGKGGAAAEAADGNEGSL